MTTTTDPRLSPLLAQFDFAMERLVGRLDGLTDDEYFWEPVQGCWNLRRRNEVTTSRAIGGGEWAIEYERDPGEPPPFTTLAWRLCHLASSIALRADYTTGTRAMTPDDYVMPTTASDGVEALKAAGDAWRNALTAANEVELGTVGHSSFPWGLDPELPFIEIVWWVNQEVLHHGAEIAMLRDLYAARGLRSEG